MADEVIGNGNAAGTPVAQPAPQPIVPQAAAPLTQPTPPPQVEPPIGRPKLSLSQDDLNERLRRAKSVALKELFGTDDVTQIRAIKTKAEELERTAEEQKRKQMTEVERMKYDHDKVVKENERLRGQLESVSEREVVREQHGVIERIALRHVNPLYVEEASLAFAREVATSDPKVIARWTEKDIAKWFQKYVERKPAFAASPNARKVRTPAGSPTPPPRPRQPANASTNGGKSFKPGAPNSTSRTEARTEAKKLGYNW